jgi:hypothetical protein
MLVGRASNAMNLAREEEGLSTPKASRASLASILPSIPPFTQANLNPLRFDSFARPGPSSPTASPGGTLERTPGGVGLSSTLGLTRRQL